MPKIPYSIDKPGSPVRFLVFSALILLFAVESPLSSNGGSTQASNDLHPLPPAAVRFFVMIDPGHGGEDQGAQLNERVVEKDITLALARKLRTELQDRGVPAVLLREGDSTLSYDQRAVTTNSRRAALYIGIHAGVPGAGVRVYTAMMPAPGELKKHGGPFVPWKSAQSEYLVRSQTVANSLVAEFSKARLVSGSATAPLPPLNSIAAPAVAIEVAPPTVSSKPEALNAQRYQQAIAIAAATAIANVRARIEERP